MECCVFAGGCGCGGGTHSQSINPPCWSPLLLLYPTTPPLRLASALSLDPTLPPPTQYLPRRTQVGGMSVMSADSQLGWTVGGEGTI